MKLALGIVLAGGLGERLGGGRVKALEVVAGRTLLARAIERIAAAADDWCVAAPRGLDLPVAPERRVDDAPGIEGPLGGVVAALERRAGRPVVVLGVDFPLLEPGALEALAEHLGEASAVLPAPHGAPQPLVAVYSADAARAISAAAARGERSLRRAALALDPRLLGDADLAALPGGLASFLNVNTPDERVAAERALAATPGRPA